MSDLATRLCLMGLVLMVVAPNGQTRAAVTAGSNTVDRPYADSSAGQVYIYAGGSFTSSVRVTKFSWFGNGFSGARVMTPILFEKLSDEVFAVRGVGAGQKVTASSQIQAFDFDVQLGTDVTANGNYTFGFINALVNGSGSPTYSSTGTVDFSSTRAAGAGAGGAATTNRWVFTPTLRGLHVALGTTFGVPGSTATFGLNHTDWGPWNVDRTYSASLTSVPAQAPPPTPIEPTPGDPVVTAADLPTLGEGFYRTLYISGVRDAVGHIMLSDVTVTRPGEITGVGGGEIRYQGQLANLLGEVFQVKSGQSDSSGLRLTVIFRVPSILGGANAEFQFLVTPDCVLVPVGAHIEIPGTLRKEAFTIERAYLDILPEESKFGGGGLFGLDSIGRTFGGWIDLKSGIGPVVNGRPTVDVTKFGAGAGSLDIPIGTTGAFLDYVAGFVENAGGLSDPARWDKSNFIGQFDIRLGPSVPIGPTSVSAYVFSGEGVWSVHDGSFDFTGAGKLLNIIETSSVRAQYQPPCNITVTGSFDAGIYSGSMTLHQAGNELTGDLHGHLSIPGSVPIIGGKSLARVDASLRGSSFHGTASVEITPGIPEVCVPETCANVPPCVTVWGCWDTCQSCTRIPFVGKVCSPPYPCDCRNKDVCGPWVCTPGFCTPAVPPVTVSFGFSFDMSSGGFSFDVGRTATSGAGSSSADSGGYTFLSNWSLLKPGPAIPDESASRLNPLQPLPDSTASHQTFTVDRQFPGVVFRVAYGSDAVASVTMSVRTPTGIVLSSGEGALPFGYQNHLGYSRFNPEAREQVILLVNPAAGAYEVIVEDSAALGEFSIEALVQDAPPTGRITSVQAGPDDGQYVINWEDDDLEGANTVRIYLDAERGGYDGFPVATVEAAANAGNYTIDTTNLDIPAGHYFVALVIEDGVNAPLHCVSDAVIEVAPAGRPEPVSGLQFLPGDGGFQIQWTASATEGVIGYLVQWTEDHEDLGAFDHQLWVSAGEDEQLATVVPGLTNGIPVLVRVVAVGADLHRSPASEILRITPYSPDARHAPQIISIPDQDATAGHAYVYSPLFTDFDSAESHEWSLVQSPDGMTIDAPSGLVQWTPTIDQLGYHDVILQVEEAFSGETVNTTQTFQLHVYPADQPHGLEAHLYHFVTHPPHSTPDGVTYQYQPVVRGPDQNLWFELLAGPEGMTMDAVSGLVTWAVPAGARGAWVRLEAIADGQHSIEQDYYLFVQRADHLLDPAMLDDDGADDWCNHECGLFLCPAQCGTLCGAGALPWMGLTTLSLVSLRRRCRAAPHSPWRR